MRVKLGMKPVDETITYFRKRGEIDSGRLRKPCRISRRCPGGKQDAEDHEEEDRACKAEVRNNDSFFIRNKEDKEAGEDHKQQKEGSEFALKYHDSCKKGRHNLKSRDLFSGSCPARA